MYMHNIYILFFYCIILLYYILSYKNILYYIKPDHLRNLWSPALSFTSKIPPASPSAAPPWVARISAAQHPPKTNCWTRRPGELNRHEISWTGWLHLERWIRWLAGWWLSIPLWKMMEFVSWDDEIPNIWKNKKCSKPPTSWYAILGFADSGFPKNKTILT